MKTLNKYSFLFKDLNTDEKQILGGGIIAILGFSFIIWLMSTNTFPVLDTKAYDPQTHQKNTYELSPSYDKYMNHVYNDKFK